jgi:LmbE family N-acetylglucosaminyl deacetylase
MAWEMNFPPRVRLDMSPEAEAKRAATKAKRYANWFAKLSPGEQRRIEEARKRHEDGVAAGLWDRRGRTIK